jgi:heme/copper-type cytochrome/quinol oxidase subunit 2
VCRERPSIDKAFGEDRTGDQTVSRAAFLLAVLAVVGVLGGCGRDPGPTEAPEFGPPVNEPGGASAGPAPAPVGPTIQKISITVRGGQVTGDTGRVTVPLGTPVTVSVTSDVADEIHVHGYDRKGAIPAAGSTGSVSFTADTPGVFEVELEESKIQLVQLAVS